MQERQLAAFHAFMVAGTVTAAAARLRISQPAVSKLLSALERETGLLLFTRERQRLLPTAEGRYLHQEVARHFSGMERIVSLAKEIRGLKAGKITIASLPALGASVLPRALASFLEDRPDTRIELRVRPSPQVVDWTINQQVDLGVSVIPTDHPHVECQKLAEVQAVCVLPAGHRLAHNSVVAPGDLRNERFISLGNDDSARHLIDLTFERAGVERILQIETPFSEVACAFVASGAGVSIVDSITASEYRSPRLVVRRFTPHITFNMYLLSPTMRLGSRLVQAFIELLRVEASNWV